MVETCRKNLWSLRVEHCLWYLSLVTLKNGSAGKSGHIIDSRSCIDTGGDQTRPYSIKVKIEYLISMPFQDWHAFTWSNIPNSARFINRCCSTHITTKLELCAWNLSWMTLQYMNRLAWFSIPNLNYLITTIAVPSKEPVSILSPSALKLRDTIYPSWPLRVECSLPVYKSQSLAVWSIEPVAHKLLWGSKATATT